MFKFAHVYCLMKSLALPCIRIMWHFLDTTTEKPFKARSPELRPQNSSPNTEVSQTQAEVAKSLSSPETDFAHRMYQVPLIWPVSHLYTCIPPRVTEP